MSLDTLITEITGTPSSQKQEFLVYLVPKKVFEDPERGYKEPQLVVKADWGDYFDAYPQKIEDAVKEAFGEYTTAITEHKGNKVFTFTAGEHVITYTIMKRDHVSSQSLGRRMEEKKEYYLDIRSVLIVQAPQLDPAKIKKLLIQTMQSHVIEYHAEHPAQFAVFQNDTPHGISLLRSLGVVPSTGAQYHNSIGTGTATGYYKLVDLKGIQEN